MMVNDIAGIKDTSLADAYEFIINKLNALNKGMTKRDFFDNNIIDFTDVTYGDMMLIADEVLQFGKDNGCYAALPPFETGSFIDRSERRYTYWKVLDINEDFFRIELYHYPIFFSDYEGRPQVMDLPVLESHGECWFLACKVVMKVKLLDEKEREDIIFQNPVVGEELTETKNVNMRLIYAEGILKQARKNDGLIGGIIESCEFFTPKAFEKIGKMGKYSTPDGKVINGGDVREIINNTNEIAMDYAKKTMVFTSVGPLMEALTYVNYMLSDKNTSSSTLRKISSSYALSSEVPTNKKERHFGKIKVVSEKKPRQITKENVQRIYKTLSWSKRSHVRHLKSGKVIPIKSQVCHRHFDGDKADAQKVIYKF